MRTLIAAALAAFIAMPATAAELPKADQAYVTILLSSLVVASKCPGYDVVARSMVKVGDEIGVSDTTPDAIQEFLKMHGDMDYDRSLLVPDVTRFAIKVFDGLGDWWETNPKKLCREMPQVLLQRGTIEKK